MTALLIGIAAYVLLMLLVGRVMRAAKKRNAAERAADREAGR